MIGVKVLQIALHYQVSMVHPWNQAHLNSRMVIHHHQETTESLPHAIVPLNVSSKNQETI
jgi:hypothetical protein